jgi:hypothetical protein
VIRLWDEFSQYGPPHRSEAGAETMMGYMIAYRRSSQHDVRYLHEREYHLAWDTAEAVLLEGYELLSIQFTANSHPLTVAEVHARCDAKTEFSKISGGDPYAREEAYLVERLRAADPN